MKKIIVQEYDPEKYTAVQIKEWHENLQKRLSEDYLLITTPFKTYMANPEDKIIYIQDKSYSTEELLEVIEKANMYDGLCR